MPAKPVEGRRLNEYQAVPRDALALRARARVNRGVEAVEKPKKQRNTLIK